MILQLLIAFIAIISAVACLFSGIFFVIAGAMYGSNSFDSLPDSAKNVVIISGIIFASTGIYLIIYNVFTKKENNILL
jgi:hypothetical protein